MNSLRYLRTKLMKFKKLKEHSRRHLTLINSKLSNYNDIFVIIIKNLKKKDMKMKNNKQIKKWNEGQFIVLTTTEISITIHETAIYFENISSNIFFYSLLQ